MKKMIIHENQKGLLFKNGVYTKLLSAGKYHTTKNRQIELVSMNQPLHSEFCACETLLADPAVKNSTVSVEVGDSQYALCFVDGNYHSLLRRGKYTFWNTVSKHTFMLVDASTPIVDERIPRYVLAKISSVYLTKIEVSEYQKAIVCIDGMLHAVHDAGTYYYWSNVANVETHIVDTRKTQLNISGQELLTADKVTLRINFVCNYRITDCVKAVTEIDNYMEQLHVTAQLALREFVGKYRLDELLANKDELALHVFERLKAKERSLYVEIYDAGVKDIILPGEIRDIMNTVLIAEKQAQANVITRREEVASTRSLLNTAKLMDENQTLYKLKELEFIERICANVGNINVSGNVLAQLTEVLRGNA